MGAEVKDVGILKASRFTAGQCLLTVPGVGGSGTGLKFRLGAGGCSRQVGSGHRCGWSSNTPDLTNEHIMLQFASCGFVCVHEGVVMSSSQFKIP